MQDHKRDCDIKKQAPYFNAAGNGSGSESSRYITDHSYNNRGQQPRNESNYQQNQQDYSNSQRNYQFKLKNYQSKNQNRIGAKRGDSYQDIEQNKELSSPILKKDQSYRRKSDMQNVPYRQNQGDYSKPIIYIQIQPDLKFCFNYNYQQRPNQHQSDDYYAYNNNYQEQQEKQFEKQSQSHQSEPSFCQFLDLTLFKINPCQLDSNSHNLKRCPYYHDQKKDQRRPLGSYQSEICQQVLKGKESNIVSIFYQQSYSLGVFLKSSKFIYECQNGEACQKSHNRVEEFYHPDKYKAKFCSSYINGTGECEYGEYCSFAHSESEISVELIDKFVQDSDFYMFHFKTVWCPYNETNHLRDQCVFSHNWQDFRRKPQLYNYSKDQCNNWGSRSYINNYREGCPNEYHCMHSHGWKEQEYHPENYKLNPCKHGEQCNKPHCSYYHSDKDKRQPMTQWFKVFPKTRLVNFPSNYYMPYLRNLTQDRDFMGGIKQTSFSRTTTDISFQSQINLINQLTPSTNNSSINKTGSPSNTMVQTKLFQNQAQQNFNINAPQFVPSAGCQQNEIQNMQIQSNNIHKHRPSQLHPQSNYLQLIQNPDINSQKRMSQSPILYQGFYSQPNIYLLQEGGQQQQQSIIQVVSNFSHQSPQSFLSPDQMSLGNQTSQVQSQYQQQLALDQIRKRHSIQQLGQSSQPITLDHQSSMKRHSIQAPYNIQPQILIGGMVLGSQDSFVNEDAQSVGMMRSNQSDNPQMYFDTNGPHDFINYDQQHKCEPRTPELNMHKEFYKNINSEPKKKSLQIFEGMHRNPMEQQNEVPGQESSNNSDDDEDSDQESDAENQGNQFSSEKDLKTIMANIQFIII